MLFVIGNLDPGGSERQLVELLERIHPLRLNASVAVLKPSNDPQLTQRVRAIGIDPHVLSDAGTPRVVADATAVLRIAGLMRAHRPDAVYAWLEEAALLSVPVARACHLPSLVARRNVCGSSLERLPPMRVAIRRAESLASVVTGNSGAVVQEAIARGIRPNRLRLVQNGHASALALPMPPGPSVALGYVAHLRSEKGHLRLLEALSRVRAKAAWHIDLAGNDGLAGLVQSETERRGLKERVSLVGPVRDLRAFWRDHDVAVLLSDYEGSPNALIEAGMAGRPLVGTDSGGTREVVTPGTGFLVPLNDPVSTAETLDRLIDDRELRERMGAAAHDYVATQFSMERFVNGHLTAIEEALVSSEVSTS